MPIGYHRVMSWSVFIRDETLPLRAPPIAKLVREAAGGVVLDIVQRIRSHYGWVAQGLEEGQAARLVDLLEAAGQPALRKPEERLVPIEKRVVVHKALLREDGLHVPVNLRGDLRAIPWQEVSVVSAGKVAWIEEEKAHEPRSAGQVAGDLLAAGAFLATGIPVRRLRGGRDPKPAVERVEREAVLVHLIVAAERTALEVRPPEFDFGYLGDRLAPRSRDNLLLFFGDLLRLAAAAHFTEQTLKFLEGGDLGRPFESVKDFQAFNRWIVEKSLPEGVASA